MDKTYENFDWETYINIYNDLKNDKYISSKKENAWKHWCDFGKNENRQFNLFLKYYLDNNSIYEVLKNNNSNEYLHNHYWLNIYCENIDDFDNLYSDTIKILEKYYSIIITFSNGTKIPNNDFLIIKVKNNELDNFISVYNYLSKNTEFKYIFFIDPNENKEGLNEFIVSKKQINYIYTILNKFDILCLNKFTEKLNLNNIFSINYDLKKYDSRSFICSKKIIEDIFNSKISINSKYDINNFDFYSFFLNTCIHLKKNVKLLNKNNILPENKLEYNFNTNLYYLLNGECDNDNDNSIESIEKIKNKLKDNKKLYSLDQILNKLPINFDIEDYCKINKLYNLDKYQIINHYITNNEKNNEKNNWIDIQDDKFNNINTFVYIFPQFHEIPENNEFWGKGFTEWWNVLKNYQIHNKQLLLYPHHDIGYYNLTNRETRERWTSYKNKYGFDGFIYCHFWFSKGIIMNRVLDKILEDNHPDGIWFLNWINENWTKRWDGGNNDILLDVKLDEDSCRNHFKVLCKYFNHKNYFKKDNKPYLGLYRPNEIPMTYINLLNKLAIENGFNGVCFVKTLNMKWSGENIINNNDFCEIQFEYPMNYSGTLSRYNPEINKDVIFKNQKYKAKNINWDIRKHYQALLEQKYDKETMRGISPTWDNFPRHTTLTSYNSTFMYSNSFDFYLTCLKQFILLNKEGGEYHMINAMNEWAEQCIMEPSIQDEYSYLEAYKLAKKTDLLKVNEKMLDKLIYYNNKKRLVFVSHTNFNSGAPIVLKNLLNYFDKNNNYEIYVIITNNFNNRNNEKWNNVKFIYLNFNNKSKTECKINTKVASEILQILNPDIVFLNTIATYEFIKASNDLGINNILYIHEKENEIFRIQNCNHEFAYLPDINEIKKVKKVYVCYNDLSFFEKRNINVEVLMNGINFDDIDNKIKEEPVNYDKPTFGMVGFGTYRKGFDIFVNLAKNNKNYDFIWIGPNQDFIKIDIPSNMKVTGYVDNPLRYIKNLEAILFTPREDPFPLFCLEAMYLNKKIIITNEFKNNIGVFNIIEKYGLVVNNLNNFDLIMKYQNKESHTFIKDNFSIKNTFNKLNSFIMKQIKIKSDYINIIDNLTDIIPKINYNAWELPNKNILFNKHSNNQNIVLNKNVAITLQVHSLNNFDLIEKYVNYIITDINKKKFLYDIYIACSNPDLKENDFYKYFDKKRIFFIQVENLGTDLYKFLKTIELIYNKSIKYDYILKIHSKTDRTWFEGMLNFLKENPLDLFEKNNLLGMICGNKYTRILTKDGTNYNHKIENNYYDFYNYLGDLMDINVDKCFDNMIDIKNEYLKEEIDLNQYKINNEDLKELSNEQLENHFKNRAYLELRTINDKLYNKLNVPKYNSGTIFMCRGNVIYNFITKDNIKEIEVKLKELNEYGYFNDLDKPRFTHALERFMGLLCYANSSLFYSLP